MRLDENPLFPVPGGGVGGICVGVTVPLADPPVKGEGERRDCDDEGVSGVGVVDAEEDCPPAVERRNALDAESVRLRPS